MYVYTYVLTCLTGSVAKLGLGETAVQMNHFSQSNLVQSDNSWHSKSVQPVDHIYLDHFSVTAPYFFYVNMSNIVNSHLLMY